MAQSGSEAGVDHGDRFVGKTFETHKPVENIFNVSKTPCAYSVLCKSIVSATCT